MRRDTRRSARLPYRLEVALRVGGERIRARTLDVSFHGLSVVLEGELPTHQVVRMAVADPRGTAALPLLGIVVRRIDWTGANTPAANGFGISLFGNDRATEARWVDLIRHVRDTSGAVTPVTLTKQIARRRQGRPTTGPSPLAAASIASPFPRVDVQASPEPPRRIVVRMRLRSLEELFALSLAGRREGALWMKSRTLVPVGSHVAFAVLHPSDGSRFEVPGKIVQMLDSVEPDERALHVRFAPGAFECRAWRQFASSAGFTAGTDSPNHPPADRPRVQVHRTPGVPVTETPTPARP